MTKSFTREQTDHPSSRFKTSGTKRVGPTSMSKKSGKRPDTKRPGPKCPDSKRRGPKCQGAKHPGAKRSFAKPLGPRHPVPSPHDCKTSWVSYMIVTVPGTSLWLCHFHGPLIVKLLWASLWLWNFMGSLNDCDTYCGSLWLWYFLYLFMIITLIEPSLHYYEFSSMILTLPDASLWLWGSFLSFRFDLWPLNWFDIIRGNMILFIKSFHLQMIL